MVRPKVVFVRGLVGAGKTTYAKTKFPNYIYLDADTYFEKFRKMKLPDEFQNAHNWCRSEMVSSIDKGLNVVVANTFSTNSELQSYVRLIKEKASHTIIKVTSKYTSIHCVPDDAVRTIAYRWENIEGEVCDELPYNPNINKNDEQEDVDVEALYRRLAELEVERARIMVQLIKS